MKKIILGSCLIIASLMLVACGAFSTSSTMSDFIVFDEVYALHDQSDHVVLARILDETTELVDTLIRHPQIDPYEVFTINTIEILEVFSGSLRVGDITRVWQLGGRYGNTQLNNYDKTSLALGESLVLFLNNNTFDANRPLGLTAPTQSAYHFPSIIPFSVGDDFELESVNPSNPLSLTLGDIINITNETTENE